MKPWKGPVLIEPVGQVCRACSVCAPNSTVIGDCPREGVKPQAGSRICPRTPSDPRDLSDLSELISLLQHQRHADRGGSEVAQRDHAELLPQVLSQMSSQHVRQTVFLKGVKLLIDSLSTLRVELSKECNSCANTNCESGSRQHFSTTS